MTVEKKFSKNLLEMKFMQKTKHKLDERKTCAENKQLEKRFLTKDEGVKCKNDGVNLELIYEKRRQNLENLHECGRFSYKNFNPEVEKCMQICQNLAEIESLQQQNEKDGKEIDDEEFADRYTSLKVTLHKKFTSKKRKIDDEKTKKFKKPKD